MADLQAAKADLRNLIRLRLANLEPAERLGQQARILEHLADWFTACVRHKPGILLAYWPVLTEEPDFREWLQGLLQENVAFGLPRMDWQRRMLSFHEVTDFENDLEVTRSGVVQPTKSCRPVAAQPVSAILVPGLAFDRQGGRLGRGAGFYDRTLAELPPEIPRWSVAFSAQVVLEVPMAEWDQRLHGLILPTGIESF